MQGLYVEGLRVFVSVHGCLKWETAAEYWHPPLVCHGRYQSDWSKRFGDIVLDLFQWGSVPFK